MNDKWCQEEIWEQLADGGLPPEQLAELISACDQRPELWRRCALALLEEDTLEKSLRAYAKELPVFSQPAHQEAKLSNLASLGTDRESVHNASLQDPSSVRKAPSLWINNLALAATLLLAFMIGWQASRRVGNWSSGAASSNELAGSPSPTIKSMINGPLQANPDPNLNRMNPVPQESTLFASNTVGMDSEMIDRVNADAFVKAIDTEWNPELDRTCKDLQRQGYDVESQEGLMPVWLYDGSSAVVPFQQIKVRPKPKNNAY